MEIIYTSSFYRGTCRCSVGILLKMNGTYKQDLPPEGGYPGIKFTRNIPKQRFSGLTVIVGGISFMVFGWVVGISQNKERR